MGPVSFFLGPTNRTINRAAGHAAAPFTGIFSLPLLCSLRAIPGSCQVTRGLQDPARTGHARLCLALHCYQTPKNAGTTHAQLRCVLQPAPLHRTICQSPPPCQNCVQVLRRGGGGLSVTRRTSTPSLLLLAGRCGSTSSSLKPRAVSRDVIGQQHSHYQAAAALEPAAVPQLPNPAPQSYVQCPRAPVSADPSPSSTPAAPGERQSQHVVNAAFGAFYCYLGLMTAAATSPDWHLDFLSFGGLWGLLWAACTK